MLAEDQGNNCGFYGDAELNEVKSSTKVHFIKKEDSHV